MQMGSKVSKRFVKKSSIYDRPGFISRHLMINCLFSLFLGVVCCSF